MSQPAKTAGGTSKRQSSKGRRTSRLETQGRILSLIEKAEQKRVAKRKIIQFLKKKGISEAKIIDAYQAYYVREGLYEITFQSRPLGFSIIMDTRGKNAIVSSIQDENNARLGMKLASRMYEVNGKRVDDLKHKEILKILKDCDTPFYVVFREARKKKNLDRLHKKMAREKEKAKEKEAEPKWLDAEEHESDSGSETGSSDYSSGSETSSSSEYSYSSDDDAAHVEQHFKRKKKGHHHHHKKKRASASKGLFKPSELQQWDEDAIDTERGEMFKELARLMAGAATKDPVAVLDVREMGMTEKRQNTLRTLIATTPAGRDSISSNPFGVVELNQEDEEETNYDREIFKYLQDLTGDADVDPYSRPSTTPSMSMVMKDLWTKEDLGIEDEPEVQIRLPDSLFNGPPKSDEPEEDGDREDTESLTESKDKETDKEKDAPAVPEEKKDDALAAMKEGTTLMKYGRFGGPKYRTFQLSADHRYLLWFSPKKDQENTKVPLKDIMRIDIGKESEVVKKTKNTEVHETSFTIIYGKANQKNTIKSLTVTAKNAKEAYVWAQGLKILSDAAKAGKKMSEIKKVEVESKDDGGDVRSRQQSVIISMDHVRSQSVLNLFSKSGDSTTVKALFKRHAQLKKQLQKCVDFVMTKQNYKTIKGKGEIDQVKEALENLDQRLRRVKQELDDHDPTRHDLSVVKSELFSVHADLDAFKQKLTALVRKQNRL